MRFLRISFLLCFLFRGLLFAQDFRATLTGTVTDSSRSAIPDAAVQATNTATNEAASARTDGQGNYTIPFLKPGSYTVTAQADGFKKFVRSGVILDVAQTATINMTLEVGVATQEVTVSAEVPLLETAKADRGGIIDTQRVTEFPLNARNPFMLSMLTAGVNYNGNAIYQRPFDNGAIAEWGINGGARNHGGNEFLLDGASNNAQAGGNNLAYVPPVDSVAEFKIQTNSYDAQYGKTSGGIINVSLKSGTNTLHGTGYEFARRNALDANSFQNNAKGAPRDGHFLDQYGVQLGGPVYIPKFYDGRDKTFFMFNYEGYHEATPNPVTASVPTPEMIDGDFSKLGVTIYDPNRADSNGVRPAFVASSNPASPDYNPACTSVVGCPNIIPTSRINPFARKILGYMPRPNTTGSRYAQKNLFLPGGNNLDRDDFYNVVIKVDKNIGDKHRMFYRYAGNLRTENRGGNGILEGPASDRFILQRVNKAAVVDWVATFGPTLFFNLRTSFNRYIEGTRDFSSHGFDLTTLGFPASLVKQLPRPDLFGKYAFGISNNVDKYITLGNTTFNPTYTNTFAVHPSLTKIHGAHSFKTGVDMRWIQYAQQDTGNPFRLESGAGFTQKIFSDGDTKAVGDSGNAIATFLLGTPSTFTVDNNAFPMYLYRYLAPYVQDDWKVSRRLTLNLGLRWDFNIPPNERYNKLNRSFDTNTINPVDQLVDHSKFPGLPVLRGGLLFAGVNGVPRIATDIDWHAVQPRFGFAYLLKSKLVMRGGWGRYYVNPNNDYLQTTGYSQSTPYIASQNGNRQVLSNTINNPFPNGILVPPGSSLGLLTFLGRGPTIVNTAFKIPYVDQFSFGFEYELPSQSKLEVSYVGSRSHKLEDQRTFNEIDLAMRQNCDVLEGGKATNCTDQVTNPFTSIAAFRGTNFFDADKLSKEQLSRPFPEFTGMNQKTRNDGGSWYNSLQMTLEKRAKGGLTLMSTYTLSKQIDRIDFNDPQKNIMRQGLAEWDRPHRITLASVYQLPFGPGRRWLNTSHSVWSRLIGGWENTVLFQWQSGAPWKLPSNVIYVRDAKLPNVDWSAPVVYGARPCVAKMGDDGVITLLEKSTNAQFGCTLDNYNFLQTPSFAPRFTPDRDPRIRRHTAPQLDVSLNKMTRITEKFGLQLRAEVFNALNKFMYHRQDFENNPASENFGNIRPAEVGIGSSNFPRQIQLAVKFIW